MALSSAALGSDVATELPLFFASAIAPPFSSAVCELREPFLFIPLAPRVLSLRYTKNRQKILFRAGHGALPASAVSQLPSEIQGDEFGPAKVPLDDPDAALDETTYTGLRTLLYGLDITERGAHDPKVFPVGNRKEGGRPLFAEHAASAAEMLYESREIPRLIIYDYSERRGCLHTQPDGP